MTEELPPTAETSHGRRGARKIFWLACVSIVVFIVGFVLVRPRFEPSRPPAQLKLADGRILQIEGVTYGTKHRIGQRSILVDRFGSWMPRPLRVRLSLKLPQNTIELERPGLVVWVNAIDPASGTNVDCQGIRTEFVDAHGDLFGQDTSSWFGGQTFWRVGHIFYSYPRSETQLTFRVTPWKKNNNVPVTAQLFNPHVAQPANWSGQPVPQTKATGPIEITLTRLVAKTNELTYWQTPARYFEPVWELSQNGRPVAGWSEPEWTAEDATGNRGRFPGLHHAALRFAATVYPAATNAEATLLLATLPRVDLSVLTNQLLWNSKIMAATNEIVALGICPPGVYTFAGGDFDPTGPRMGGVRGGSASGWTGQTKRLTPLKVQSWHGHYTPTPTIYIRAAKLPEPGRLAVRLRDGAGQLWVTEPESQGNPDGVHAFLLKLPSAVTNVVPEVVLLRPVEAEFLVQTKTATAATK